MNEKTPDTPRDDASPVETEHNAYGAPSEMGLSIPPYYQPTPSVANKTNYFPQSEPLGAD